MTETGHIQAPEDLAHHLAIQDVLFKHCRGVDRADAETLKSAYWPEAEVEYGSFNGNAHEFCGMLAEGIKRFRSTHHQVSNIIVERNGDDAVVESYVTAYHHQPGGEAVEMTYFGRYVDHMQCRGGVWKMCYRRVVMDWNQNLAESADFTSPTMAGLAKSGRKPDDPLYEMTNKIFGENR